MGDVAGTFPVGLDPIAFGALSARLDDPFADRSSVLATAGLDEATHAELRGRWSRAIAGLDEPRLRAFGDAYAAEREALAHARQAPEARAVTVDPRFLNADVQAFREQAAAVTLSAAADLPGLNVNPEPPPPAPAPVIARPPQELAATADISAFVPRPATPFVPAPATPPRRRLVRFDPQTGQPLAEPRWEDLPEPEPPKR